MLFEQRYPIGSQWIWDANGQVYTVQGYTEERVVGAERGESEIILKEEGTRNVSYREWEQHVRAAIPEPIPTCPKCEYNEIETPDYLCSKCRRGV